MTPKTLPRLVAPFSPDPFRSSQTAPNKSRRVRRSGGALSLASNFRQFTRDAQLRTLSGESASALRFQHHPPLPPPRSPFASSSCSQIRTCSYYFLFPSSWRVVDRPGRAAVCKQLVVRPAQSVALPSRILHRHSTIQRNPAASWFIGAHRSLQPNHSNTPLQPNLSDKVTATRPFSGRRSRVR